MLKPFRSFAVGLRGIVTAVAGITMLMVPATDLLAYADETADQQSGQFDWPQFLGPDRNGISRETNLMQAWPKEGPREVWRAKGGVGMSGLAISNGRLFTLVQKLGKQWAVARNAQNAKLYWEQPLAPAYTNSMGDGPRATPAIAGEFVYAFTGEGILAALKTGDGSIAWSRNLVKQLQGEIADYGMACSPLVVGDRVIVTVGAQNATAVACDRATGNIVWKAGTGDPAGYSSPALLNVGGRSQVVVFNGAAAEGLDPDSGKILWRYPYQTDYDCNIATPLAFRGNVFISAGENHGSAMLSLKPAGDKFTVSEVWTSQGVRSVLRNEWQTSILLDGYLYGFDNVGSAGPITNLTCVDANTGKQIWLQRRFGKGNLLAADGKLFITTRKGELVVVRVTPKGYEELGRKQVFETTRQAPALSNGLLYLRDGRDIICLDVRKQ